MRIIVTDEVSAEGLALLTQEPRIKLDVKLGLKKEELLAILELQKSGPVVIDAAPAAAAATVGPQAAFQPLPPMRRADAN